MMYKAMSASLGRRQSFPTNELQDNYRNIPEDNLGTLKPHNDKDFFSSCT